MNSVGRVLRQLQVVLLIFIFSFALAPSFAQAEEDSNNGSGSCQPDDSMQELPDDAKGKASPLSSESGGSEVTSAIEKWKKDHDSCKTDNKDAQKECFEACSKQAQSGYSAANILGQTNTATSGTQNSGTSTNQASQQMQTGLSGYIMKCKSAQSTCTGSCGKALKGAKEVSKKADAVKCEKKETQAACEAAKSAVKAVAAKEEGSAKDVAGGKNSQCEKEFTQKQSTAQQMMDMLKSIMQALAQAAQNQSAATEDTSSTSSTEMTCAQMNAAGQSAMMGTLTKCICGDGSMPGLDPRRAGCDMAAKSEDSSATPSGFGAAQKAAASGGSSSSGGNSESPSGLAQASPSSGGAAGGGGYGGGGGGGMPGGAAGSKGNAEVATKAGLKADIYSGDGGGGGGGGGWNFGSDGKPEAKGARGLASIHAAQALAAAKVSSSGGRTNWEKVKDRYKDNRPSFVKDGQ